jgi:hypothetical protein
MQALEVITRHALRTGDIAEVMSAFHPAAMTPEFLTLAFGSEGRDRGLSELMLTIMERDTKAVFAANDLILQNAEWICPNIDQHCLKRMVNLIKGVMGVGKATYYAVLKHMPESFAIIQLRQWENETNCLAKINTSMRESVLADALAKSRFRIAHAMGSAMLASNESVELSQLLKDIPRHVLEETALNKYLSAERQTLLLCQEKSYSQAMRVADGNERMEAIVRQSISGQFEFKGSNETWGDLFENLMTRVEETVDQERLIARFKSAAIVIFQKVQSMDEATTGRELRNDRIRFLAYQLGLEHAIHNVKNDIYHEKFLEYDLGL